MNESVGASRLPSPGGEPCPKTQTHPCSAQKSPPNHQCRHTALEWRGRHLKTPADPPSRPPPPLGPAPGAQSGESWSRLLSLSGSRQDSSPLPRGRYHPPKMLPARIPRSPRSKVERGLKLKPHVLSARYRHQPETGHSLPQRLTGEGRQKPASWSRGSGGVLRPGIPRPG